MIRAVRHPGMVGFFRSYALKRLKRTFRRIEFTGDYSGTGGSVLLVSNHVSWWDGWWNFYFADRIAGKRYYFMMAEQQLNKYPFMSRIGAFPINRNPKTIAESLGYALELLRCPKNLVLIYPQGKMSSVYQPVFRFGRGAEFIARHLEKETEVIMMAYFTENAGYRKPTVWGYFTTYDPLGGITLETDYRCFYTACLRKHIERVSE